ncbi:MAG: hypothetical protein M3335_03710 [Actinomycetota bacterium]|nr:hypothetical protein [Actinomycetota bacterium]
MKYLKMTALAAIAGLGLLAFAGTGTASATQLCTDSACNTVYPSDTTIHIVTKKAVSIRWKSGSTTIATCSNSTIHITTNQQFSITISANAIAIQFEGCNQTTHTVSNGSFDIKYTSGASGEVTGTGNSVTLGIFGTSCTYGTGAGTKLATLTGGSEPVLAISATVARTAGGFLCPTNAIWEGEYVIESPHALYVAN